MLISEFDLSSIILSLTVIVIVWKLLYKNKVTSLINKLPGPFAYPILGNIVEALEPKEKALANDLKRKEKYGPILRFWLGVTPMVLVSKAEDIETLIKSSKHSEKSTIYEFLYPWLGTGLLTSHGNKWAQRRKLITPTFHFVVLQNFIGVFQENANVLVKILEEKANTGKEVNVYPFITLCMLDIICETAMGTKINAQTDRQNEYVKSVYSLSHLATYRIERVWLHSNFIFNLLRCGRQQQKDLKTVHGFTEKVIKDRRKAFENDIPGSTENISTKKLTFLDLLLKESMTEGATPLTDEEIREEVDTFMFEGHDTTTAAANWAVLLLSHYPEIQEKVYREVKTVFDSKQNDSLTLADLAEMKLLERVIKETLRLYPSVAIMGRKVEEDVKLGNYTIPKGINIFIHTYALHRDPVTYPNPEVFDPDRFLPENSANRHPYAYIPFSAGPRNCIGQKFAMYEEKTVLSNLLLRYRFEPVGTLEDVKKIPELVLRPKNGIWVKIYKR